MNPKDRDLSMKMRGEDVKRLQEDLRMLEYSIKDKDGYFGKTTHQAVLEFQKTCNLEPTGVVDKKTAARIKGAIKTVGTVSGEDLERRYHVKGKFLKPDGTPVTGATIKAFDKELREEKLLGETKTDTKGKYTIRYRVFNLIRPEKRRADLIVRAYSSRGKEIATSSLIIGASPEQVVDLVEGNKPYYGPSEYTQLQAKLMPLLHDLDPAEITKDDIAYLARKTGLNPVHIAYFAKSILLEKETTIQAQAFYGLFRKDLPTSLPALVVQDSKVLTSALKTAKNENIISKELQPFSEITSKFQEIYIENAFKEPEIPGQSSLGDLLGTTGFDEDKQKKFLRKHIQHKGPPETFWTNLSKDPDFSGEDVKTLKFTLQLGTLTQNHVPLIRVLKEREQIGTLRDLASLDDDGWMKLPDMKIDGKLVGVPPTVLGKNYNEKKANYVKTMKRMIEDAYPTPVIASHIGDIPHAQEMQQFFEKNPDFEFRTTPINRYLAENADALTGIENAEEVRQQLGGMQRLFNISPRFEKHDAINALMGKEVTSAYAIARMGKTAFVREYEEQVGEEQASQIYANASQTVAITQMLLVQFNDEMNGTNPYVVPPYSPEYPPADLANGGERSSEDEGIPDWKTLFSSLSMCSCEHCRSVYSPAAYLVDILCFLENCIAGDRPALDVLFERRSDIEKIELTCKNTNTLMPYVDLVNEVLENAVANSDIENQTEGTEEELGVYPEHLNCEAYKILAGAYDEPGKKAVYPWTLPFDLWAEEVRLYLGHLGVQWYELMERFRKECDKPAPYNECDPPTPYDIASERISLTPREWKIITGTASDGLHEFWGMEEWSVDEIYFILRLQNVSIFLEKSGLCYESLQKLLQVDFINPDNTIQIKVSPICKLEDEEIIASDISMENIQVIRFLEGALDRIHRFVRLQRKLNWSILELDIALRKLPPGDLTEPFLVNLSHVLHLHDTLKVPLIEMFSWWSNINTISYNDEPSLYEKLFLNKIIMNPPDSAFELNEEKNELKTLNQEIIQHEPAILAALRISADDLALLIDHLHLFVETPDTKLNLANLSILYRVVSLARALDLSIRDFLSLYELSGIDPFNAKDSSGANDISAMLRFVEAMELVNTSNFSISELDYLLRHHYHPNSAVAPDEEQIGQILGELRSGLQKIAQEYSFTSDPTGERTAQALGEFFMKEEEGVRETLIRDTIAIIEHSSEKSPEEQKAFIEEHLAFFPLPFEAIVILVKEGEQPGSETADSEGEQPGSETVVDKYIVFLEDKEDRFNYVLEHLLIYLQRLQQESFVKQKLAESLGLTIEASELLLSELIPSILPWGLHTLYDFLIGDFVESEANPLTADEFPRQFKTYKFLHRTATVITKFEIPSEELKWVFEKGPDLGWLDLVDLSLEEPEPTSLFKKWFEMAKMAYLRDELPPGEPTLFSLLRMLHEATMTEDEFIKALIERTGWKEGDLIFLMGPGGFNLIFPDDYRKENALRQLIRFKHCFDLIRRLGVSAEEAWNWKTPVVDSGKAQSIRQAVRAKYDENQWLEVAKPLRDELREQQRTALVAYIIHNKDFPNIKDAEDLFGYFLIDVEMSPCMMTSRIKQAISSVQLFVNRCLMNLEPEVKFTPDDAKEWEWRKNYRVWEANRKVFLYPENWIEPELRDNKSPFFVELENELLQNDVTVETIEQAFLNYLEKLNKVARLEICGMYEQKEDGILHVFGRTYNTPHNYYYRCWVNGSYWTPWERVDVDIEGDHLIPVVYNRRLHLFWPIFKETADEKLPTNPDEPEKPKKYYEIQLAWSEYRNGKWQTKRVSDESISIEKSRLEEEELISKEFIRFYSFFDGNGDLIIALEKRHYGIFDQYPYFRFIGCEGKIKTDYDEEYRWPEYLPNTYSMYMYLEEDIRHPEDDNLYLISYILPAGDYFPDPVLGRTPGTFRILLPHQYRPFLSQAPLFYEDDKKTFFVIPRDEYIFEPLGPRHPYMTITETSGIHEYPSNRARDTVLRGLSNPGIIDSVGCMSKMEAHSGGTDLNVFQVGDNDVHTLVDNWEKAVEYILLDTPSSDVWFLFAHTDLYAFWYTYLYKYYSFKTFYHRYVCTFIKQLNKYGIDGLLDPTPNGEVQGLRRQQIKDDKFFDIDYNPYELMVDEPFPIDDIDFNGGAYSLYNWELFFHIPFLIANRLSSNQRFAEAQKWYHYIFDPTDVTSDSYPKGYWKIKPFYKEDTDKPIHELMLLLRADDELTDGEKVYRDELIKQIEEWRNNPFNPHLIARLRKIAYQKAIVGKYLDNLIAWGDYLFRQDTIESINEATQLYVLAAQILGKRPEDIPPPKGTAKLKESSKEAKTFEYLKGHLDEFFNILIYIETELLASTGSGNAGNSLIIGPTLFFCIPNNDKLLSYWDTVADRLFKIRYCMTIEGVARQLPLFQPPIEPGLLVRAAAAGLDIGSVLRDLYAPLPYYRFQFMLQKALELCADVKSLGTALLATLEKRDAEELALLRSSHEMNLLTAVRQIKEKQIDEADETYYSLEKAKALANIRATQYQELLGLESKPEPGKIPQIQKLNLIPEEREQSSKLNSAKKEQQNAMAAEKESIGYRKLPDVTLGTSGWKPVVTAQFGSSNLIAFVQSRASEKSKKSAKYSSEASLAGIKAGHIQVHKGWALQLALAVQEEEQINKQLEAARIRKEIAEYELENHDLQAKNTKEIDEYMHDKFTNQQLYEWMKSQISTIYFQTYQMAYDLAKKAEKAFQHEISDPNATFIEFGYWDSLNKGLLAGEKLHNDLKRMEVAYYEQNKREYEITKHISLAMLHPEALVMLKETGKCDIYLPEAIFDLDYSGHYMRRIKSVSLTIPCVTGPYTNVSCKLTLLSNRIRQTTTMSQQGEYAWTGDTSDNRFIYNIGGIQSIVTSSAREDNGLFELNFRDERYLPFEGAGAISNWHIELPTEFKQFDYDTISDVVIHIRYTAREGGQNFKDAVEENLRTALNDMIIEDGKTGLFRFFSAKREFPNEWHQFLDPPAGKPNQLELDLSKERFPFQFKDETIQIIELTLFVKLKNAISISSDSLNLLIIAPGQTHETGSKVNICATAETPTEPCFAIVPNTQDKILWTTLDVTCGTECLYTWVLEMTGGTLDHDAIEDIGVLCYYSI